MSGKLIFKMELFKYMKDKRYLIVTAFLAIINICSTVYLIHLIDKMGTTTNSSNVFVGLFYLFFLIAVFANIVFMFLYPFHLIAMDYKNDVMAMLMASGVNRTRLFFSKIGATLIWSLAVTSVLVLIPCIIVLLKVTQTNGVIDLVNQMLEMLNINSLSILGFSFSMLNSYINMLILIAAVTILMKGRSLTILVYFVFTMVQSSCFRFAELFLSSLNFSDVGMFIFDNLIMIVFSCILILISLNILKRQNL